jgi:hypothetical protein
MKKSIFLFITLFSFYISYPQNGESASSQNIPDKNAIINQFNKIVSLPGSPEAQAFEKYGNYDVTLHTGTPNIQIPLYVIKGSELDIPISLTYDASGIKVTQKASEVGLGWNLNVGGRITTSINGLPDFYELLQGSAYYTIKDPEVRQKLSFFKENGIHTYHDLFDSNENIDDVYNKVDEHFNFLKDVSENKYDIHQDYYNLNVMGLNDLIWFEIEQSGITAKTINNINYKVSYTLSVDQKEIIAWTITDDKGNKYFFGQDYTGQGPIEKINRISNFGDGYNLDIVALNLNYNSSWLLRKIVSANQKDTYEFFYNNHDNLYADDEEFINQTKVHSMVLNSQSHPVYLDENNNLSVSNLTTKFTTQTLTSIKRNGVKLIDFILLDRLDLKEGSEKGIDKMVVYDINGNSINNFDFEYSYFGDINASGIDAHLKKRLKLDKIKIGNVFENNFYSFEYTAPELIPKREHKGIDKMGYFNNKGGGPFEVWSGLHGSLGGADRSTDEFYSKIGTLNKIIYPTGGYSDFEFENHKKGNEIYPGLRIKSIANYSGNGELATKKIYSYPNVGENSPFPKVDLVLAQETSSDSPPIDPCRPNKPLPLTGSLSRFIYPINLPSRPNFVYRDVTVNSVSNNENTGYVHYKYYVDNQSDWVGSSNFKNYQKSLKDGNLEQEEYFDATGNLLKKITYEYVVPNSIANTGTGKFVENLPHPYTYHVVKQYQSNVIVEERNLEYDVLIVTTGTQGNDCLSNLTYQWDECQQNDTRCIVLADENNISGLYKLSEMTVTGKAGGVSKTITTEYFQDNEVTTITENEYIPHTSYLKNTTTTINDNEKILTTYTYPFELPNPSPAEIALINKNIIANPLITESYKVVDSSLTKKINKKSSIYEIIGGKPLLKAIKTAKGNDLDETRIIIHKYHNGNPIELSLANGTKVCYIWGYEGLNPIVKLENIDYNSIPTQVLDPIKNFDYNSGSESDLLQLYNNLRNALPDNVFVTTFTYKPQLGVSTITDSRGNKTIYNYDNDGRLINVLDKDNKVLSSNIYNYKTKNKISGGEINITSEIGNTVNFELDASNILPQNVELNFNWIVENSIITQDNGNSISVNFDCETLQNKNIIVKCIITDSNNQLISNAVIKQYKPSLCIIEGDINAENLNPNEVTFSIYNLSGGSGDYTYLWSVESINNGLSYVANTSTPTFSIDYDCSLILEEIRVSCLVRDANSNYVKGILYSDPYIPTDCFPTITNQNLSLVEHDSGNKILKFKIHVSGVSQNSIIYNWSIYNLSSANAFEVNGNYQGIDFPYVDQDGNYWVKYDCDNPNPNNDPQIVVFCSIRTSFGYQMNIQKNFNINLCGVQ